MKFFRLILFLVLVVAVVNVADAAESIATSCVGQPNGQQCYASDGTYNGACYDGRCLTIDEFNYKVTKVMCDGLSKNNGCYNPEPVKESIANYVCIPKPVGSSCSIPYSCRGPGCLAGAPSTCDSTPKCVRQISPDNDNDGVRKCQLAYNLADGYRYTGSNIPNTCDTALNTGGCDEGSCPLDCDDNDPYESTIRFADITSTEIVMDPEYKKETKEIRKFTPQIPVTPFDNFNIIVTVKKKCGVKSILQMPAFPASLITSDAAGKEILVSSGALSPIDLTTYQWKIVGWPNGITLNNEVMETLVDSIALKRKVFVRITGQDPNEKPKETPISMSNCVQTYGNGKHKVVNMRAFSAKLSIGNLFDKNFENRVLGFKEIDPFSTYKDKFSHFNDLQIVNDVLWGLKNGIYVNYEEPRRISSCKDASQYFFYNLKTYRGIVARVDNSEIAFLSPVVDSVVAVHETAHSFCGVYDEYPLESFKGKGVETFPSCALSPEERYLYGNTLYGEFTHIGCTSDLTYRPSFNSIMRFHVANQKFNVISCGYCLAKIIGGDPKSHWPECMKLDTIKPDCTIYDCSDGFKCDTTSKLCIKI